MAVRFNGLPEGVATWSVNEDAVSLDRSESPSGTPTSTVTGVGSLREAMLLPNKKTTITSSVYGVFESTVTDVTLTDAAWSITGGSPLYALNQIGTVKSGTKLTASQALARFFSAVGLSTSSYRVSVDAALSSRTFEVPYWRDNVWAGLRQWLSANELDLNWIAGTLSLFPFRSRTIRVQDVTAEFSAELASGSKATSVSVNIYHRKHFDTGVVYPAPATAYPNADSHFGGGGDTSIISVNAGEVSSVEIQLGAEIEAIRQPAMITSIPVQNGEAYVDLTRYPSGFYMVVGKDNRYITPAQWNDMGGGLTVKLNPDHKSVTVTVSGMNYEELSPYRIAESDGENDHNGLFLVGTNGEYVDIETVKFDTGVGDKTEYTSTIDNTSITTLTQAYHAAQQAADGLTGHKVTLTWRGPDPVRTSYGNSTNRQSFGRIVGSRFFLSGHWWRASTAAYSDATVSLEASRDTTLGDVMRKYTSPSKLNPAGRTLGQLSDYGVL